VRSIRKARATIGSLLPMAARAFFINPALLLFLLRLAATGASRTVARRWGEGLPDRPGRAAWDHDPGRPGHPPLAAFSTGPESARAACQPASARWPFQLGPGLRHFVYLRQQPGVVRLVGRHQRFHGGFFLL